MIIPFSITRFMRQALVVVIALLISIPTILFMAQPALAAPSINLSVTGVGANGQSFTISLADLSGNKANPIPIPITGEVSLTLNWNVTGFTPSKCFGYSAAMTARGWADAGQQGSGFFQMPKGAQTFPVPLAATNYILKGTLIQVTDLQERLIGITCDGYYTSFGIYFQAPPGVTGECLPGLIRQQSNNGSSTNSILGSGAVFTAASAFGSVTNPDTNNGAICSENASLSQGETSPPAFCVQTCNKYNPVRSNLQEDGSAAQCENYESKYWTDDSKTPFSYWVSSRVVGPDSISPTVKVGDTVNFNMSQELETGGNWFSNIRVGNSNGSYSNNQLSPQHFGFASYSWNFNGNSTAWNPDNGHNWSTATAKESMSYRPGVSNCRKPSAASFTDTSTGGSSEDYEYFKQQYRRDGQGSANRFFPGGVNTLMPFVQIDPPTYSFKVTKGPDGATDPAILGTEYVIDSAKVREGDFTNAIRFLVPNTYTVQITQSAYTAAVVICANTTSQNHASGSSPLNAPYNCGNGARRVQQMRGQAFPAVISFPYTVTVSPPPGPYASFTVNGIAATDTTQGSASVAATSSTATVPVSWVATNVAADSCKVNTTGFGTQASILSQPWKDNQSGLPLTNSNASISIGSILGGTNTSTLLTLTCGTGSATVTRSVKLSVSRASGGTAALTLGVYAADGVTLIDQADATNQAVSKSYSYIGDPAKIKVGWSGNIGVEINTCSATKAVPTNAAVTVSGSPWEAGQTGLGSTNGPSDISVIGVPATDQSDVPFSVTCQKVDGGTLTRTVTVTFKRGSDPKPSITFGLTNADGTSVATANDSNPSATAGSTVTYNGDTVTLNASWNAANINSSTCALDAVTPTNGASVSAPWDAAQTGLAATMTNDALTISGLSGVGTSSMVLKLSCGQGSGIVQRSISFSVTHGNSGPSLRLSVTQLDGTSVIGATDANPNPIGNSVLSYSTDPLVLNVGWIGSGITPASCDFGKVSLSNGATVSAPWNVAQSGLALTNTGSMSVNGLALNASATISIPLTCGQGAGALSRSVTFQIINKSSGNSGANGKTLNYGSGSQQW
jgi:hypothetical protein